MPLVTIDEFSGYLKRDLSDLDAYSAQLMLDGANAAVTEYCGWHIAPALTETVTVDGSGLLVQALPTLHLVSLDSVTEDGTSLDLTRIEWSNNGLMEKRSGALWTRRRRGIGAGITHGFAATPGWVTTLICAVAGRAFITPLGIVQETSGGESISYSAPRSGTGNVPPPGTVALLPVDKRMLDRIRVPLAA